MSEWHRKIESGKYSIPAGNKQLPGSVTLPKRGLADLLRSSIFDNEKTPSEEDNIDFSLDTILIYITIFLTLS